MKKLLVFICIFFISNLHGVTSSSSGSAIIPYYLSTTTYANEMGLTISNITDNNIHVEIFMYSDVGNLIVGLGMMVQLNNVAINFVESNSDNTISFDIPPSGTVSLGYGAWNGNGYGRIIWHQDSNRRTGLVAHSLRNYSGSVAAPINAGLPF